MTATHPALVLLGTLLALGAAPAQDWPHWRGPRYDGSTEAGGLPADFSKTRHVRWATDLPGPAASTPIVVGDRVFLSSVDTERQRLVALCVGRNDGKVVWRRDAGSGYKASAERGSRIARGRRSNYASPSPTTDGKRVVFFFGNGDLVAYDYEGQELWRRNVQKDYGNFAFQWTFSASPTLWEGKVFLPVLQRDTEVAFRRRGGGRRRRGGSRRRGGGGGGNGNGGAPKQQMATPQDEQDAKEAKPAIQSFVLALDPATGKTIYKHVRPSPARVESLESYTTMIPYVGPNGRKEILLAGGDVLTGQDPATGRELWRWGTWNVGHRQRSWRLVPSVVTGSGVAVVCAPKRAPVYAIKLGGKGTLDDDALEWESEGRPNFVSSDVPTPAYHDGHFYVLSDVRSALSKVRAGDGEIVWTTRLPEETRWRASPTVADGKVWCLNHGGDVVVVDAAKGTLLNRTSMGEEEADGIRASIVVAHGTLFVRTNSKLYCLGRQKQ